MIISHNGNTPVVHPTAWITPDATVCGDVSIGAHTRVLFGAKLIAEGGRIEIGEHCIILENAVVRSTSRHATYIGNHCLIGPNAHVVDCTVEDLYSYSGFHLHAIWGRGCTARKKAIETVALPGKKVASKCNPL